MDRLSHNTGYQKHFQVVNFLYPMFKKLQIHIFHTMNGKLYLITYLRNPKQIKQPKTTKQDEE